MMSIWTRGLAAALLLAGGATAIRADDPFAKKWEPWLEIGGRYSDQRTLGEANLFAPLIQTHNSLVFADLRGMFDNHDAAEGNFGLAIRRMYTSGWNVGGYGYYDVRRSSFDNVFHQVTFGAEALSRDVDLRANVYLPVGSRAERIGLGSTTSTTDTTAAVLTGTSLAIQSQSVVTTTSTYMLEKALAGFDAEIGFRVPVFDLDSGLDLRTFAGGYYFDGSDVDKVAGPRFRLELTANDVVGLSGVKLAGGVIYQHDNVRGEQWIAQARLRIPLQAPAARASRPLTYMERRMADAIVRDVDIVSNTTAVKTATATSTVTHTEAAINTWNGETVTSVNYVDAGSADQADLQAALDTGGAGSVVVLNGGITATDQLIINERQTLLGGGTDLLVRGAVSGVEVVYTATGAAGSFIGDNTTVTTTGGSPGSVYALVAVRDYGVIGGMTIEKTGETPHFFTYAATVLGHTADPGGSPIGIALFGNTIVAGLGSMSYGVWFNHGRDITIMDNNIAAPDGGIAVVLFDSSDNARVVGNRLGVGSAASYGLMFAGDGNYQVTIADNSIGGSVNSLLFLSSVHASNSSGNVMAGFGHCNGRSVTGVIEFTDGTRC